MMSSQTKTRLALLSIFLITILAFVLDFPGLVKKSGLTLPAFIDRPFSLGLDLQGGTHLVYQADISQIPADMADQAVEGVREVIERRVNSFGVSEPVIQTTKSGDNWRLIIELAGITDVNEAIKLIGETPLLEFKEQDPNPAPVALTAEQTKELEDFNALAKARAQEALTAALKPGADFAALAQTYSEDPGSKDTGGSLGFAPMGILIPEFQNVCFDKLAIGEINKELVQTPFGWHIIKKDEEQGSGAERQVKCSHILLAERTPEFYLDPNQAWAYTGLTGSQLKRAQVVFEPNTQEPQISLEFNAEGAELFKQITTRNLNKPVGIFLDGTAISAPTVQSAITDGKAIISGNFNITDARLLSQRLNAGALPVPIELVSQQTVEASLGNVSVAKSINAGILGFIVVSLFMILYYRFLGLTAVLALISYGLIVLAIFKLIPITLTLSGLAGFILSIGMAVDANVLVFERLKEELRSGKALTVAINEGFKRAWPSILDGHISTLITCAILIGFTTSSVKGFALALAIGLLISMFTAMVITKSIIKSLMRFRILDNLWLFGVSNKYKK